jgi:hypothetical protein
MWDVLATSVLGIAPAAFEFETMELAVSIDEPNAGQTFRQSGSGHLVSVATQANKDIVLDFVLAQFRR